ncbi:diguanylate cyclase [Vibrio galatheae]|uniref:diguanylate cyclase n=1 Tax=Vibrio galatheae TaxID=579748 RepID=A0A0F4NJS4_9VIBR|nr:GGDEF domain-containing protein [Vibrio galatheae]KJY83154.1 diguanylate cyclase [Vibrio galatheae]
MNNDLIQCNATQQLRRKVLIGMCIVLGVAALLFGLSNIFYFGPRAKVLGMLELAYFAASLAMLVHIWRRKQPSWFLIFHCVVLTFLICFGTYVSRIESSLYLWAVALPTVFYLALGLRVGFYWSLSCMLLELVALHFALQETVLVRSAVLLNFVLAYIFVWTISHVYEDSRVKGVDRLNALAHQDALTGAQNRLSLVTAFKQSPAQLEGSYLFTLDIDDFKSINDNYGHAAGDEVLKEVVYRLSQVVSRQHIYRMGGEEFVVVLTAERVDEVGAITLVKQLQSRVMKTPIRFEDIDISVTFSGGLEQFTQQAGLDKTLSRADNGLYLAKKSGKQCAFYQGTRLS